MNSEVTFFEDLIYMCHLFACLCGQDTEEVRIYCLSIASSVQSPLMHTIMCFPLIHHVVSAVRILCVTPS